MKRSRCTCARQYVSSAAFNAFLKGIGVWHCAGIQQQRRCCLRPQKLFTCDGLESIPSIFYLGSFVDPLHCKSQHTTMVMGLSSSYAWCARSRSRFTVDSPTHQAYNQLREQHCGNYFRFILMQREVYGKHFHIFTQCGMIYISHYGKCGRWPHKNTPYTGLTSHPTSSIWNFSKRMLNYGHQVYFDTAFRLLCWWWWHMTAVFVKRCICDTDFVLSGFWNFYHMCLDKTLGHHAHFSMRVCVCMTTYQGL